MLRVMVLVGIMMSTALVSRGQGAAAGDGKAVPAGEPKAQGDQSQSQSAVGVAAARARDTIFFRNGDFLYGALEGIDPTLGVFWAHPDSKEPIEFDGASLSEVQLGYRVKPQSRAAFPCRVHLTNRDELDGDLRLFDSDKLVLDTWYAGTLEIPRKRVQYLMPRPADQPPVFEGPSGLEGWTLGKVAAGITNAGQWKFKGGAFYAVKSASIARDVKLPDVASIQFDIAWKGMLYMAIALYTDYLHPVSLTAKESEPDFGGFYSLQLNNYTANLLPVTKMDPLRYLGQTVVPGFGQKNEAHLEIRVSKPKRTIALMADGVLLKQWFDTEGFIGQGTGMRFVHQGQGAIRLSNLRVVNWDGQFEERPTNPPDSKMDLAKLQNGDRVVGQLQGIREGKMFFVPAEGVALEVPLVRVKLIEMAGQRIQPPKGDSPNVRATFRGGGALSFQLEKWGEDEAIGHSPNFGKAIFKSVAFERIQFLEPASGSPPSALGSPRT